MSVPPGARVRLHPTSLFLSQLRVLHTASADELAIRPAVERATVPSQPTVHRLQPMLIEPASVATTVASAATVTSAATVAAIISAVTPVHRGEKTESRMLKTGSRLFENGSRNTHGQLHARSGAVVQGTSPYHQRATSLLPKTENRVVLASKRRSLLPSMSLKAAAARSSHSTSSIRC